MRIGFTGTRKGMTELQLLALTALLITTRNVTTEFHHGDCVGADEQSDALARTIKDIVIVIHPPSDNRMRANCGDKTWTKRGFAKLSRVLPAKEYLARNRDIVDDTDILVAAPETESETWKGGTWYTVRYARKVGRRIAIIEPSGSVREEKR